MIKKRVDLVISDLIRQTIALIRFSYHRHREHQKYGAYEFPFLSDTYREPVYLLANGPSLKDELLLLEKDEKFVNAPKFVLNFFSLSESYKKIKPEMYCLADKGFFIDNPSEGHVKTIKAINEATDWPITLYVPYPYLVIAQRAIVNRKVTIVPLSTLKFEGFEKKKYLYYKKGYAVPSYVNVTIMMEYILLNLGYKDIRLYGVDHTFFTNMAVDDNNHIGYMERHFYGDEFVELKWYDGSPLKMTEWLWDKYLTFKEHENMRGYADYLGAQIVNCTKVSLIDSYVRSSQIEEKKK